MIKKSKNRIKAKIRKSKIDIKKNIDNFFEWVKGAKLVQVNEETQNFEYKIIK